MQGQYKGQQIGGVVQLYRKKYAISIEWVLVVTVFVIKKKNWLQTNMDFFFCNVIFFIPYFGCMVPEMLVLSESLKV